MKDKSEIVDFIHEMGLVSALGGNELPSFISAVLGRPWKPSEKGFKGWLDWWSVKISGERVARVSSEIERRDDVVATRIFRRSKTIVSNKLWPIISSIVNHHSEAGTRKKLLPPLDLKLLETIGSEGPIRTDRLRKTLRLEAKRETSRFHRSLANLESYAMIVGAEDPQPEKHLHANIWQTWEKRTGSPGVNLDYDEALTNLFKATVDACVIVREEEAGKWFRWSADMKSVKDQLLAHGSILNIGSQLISLRVQDV